MTKLQFRVLYREFLFRMVDLEVLSAHALGDSSKLLGQFASLLIFISLGLSVAAMGYGAARTPAPARLILGWAAEHFLIATTMLVVGLFAVLSWDSTFPDRRDVLVLAPLPVRARTMFLAKVAALATALGLTVGALHVLAGFFWPVALFKQSAAVTVPALTYEPAMAPVEAPDLHSVLDSDLSRARTETLRTGATHPWADLGIAIGVSKHGTRRVFVYGGAKPDSLFEIGSISKTFTGLMLARMVAKGKARFDEPVRELLPPRTVAKPAGNEIHLLDLATQHSGLPPMPSNLSRADRARGFADYHAAELYRFLAKRGVAKPAHPGFVYSNLGFGLLGQALAERSGMAYPDLLQEEVTGPLALRDTVVALTPEQEARFLQGYFEGRAVDPWDLDAFAGAGGIRSTAGDMLTYLEAHLHPEKLPPPLADAITRSHRIEADAPPNMKIALAWFYRPDIGTYWHNGGTAGYTSHAFFNPGGDYAAIVLLNHGPSIVDSSDLLGEHIRQRLAGEPALSLGNAMVAAKGGIGGLIRLLLAYWVTMLAAGAFTYCSVLAVQGLAAQLPRQYFLRLSGFLQMAAFCLFVSVYFLQPAPDDPIMAVQSQQLYRWLPSYWFLGLSQMLNGSMHPALVPLARRALIGLAVTGCGTATAFLLSYFRTLRKIVEEPDITPGSRRLGWLPRFGSSPQTAIVQFSIRSLLRSRQHRVILAFYLGIGFALAIFFLKTPRAQQELSGSRLWRDVNALLPAASIAMLGAWLAGTRVVFSMPLDLAANWIFRIMPIQGGKEILAARRRSLETLAVLPVWAASAGLLALWPWRMAAGHLLFLGLLGIILGDLFLHGAQKIPFTCSYLPGKSNFHMTFWFCIGLVVMVVDQTAQLELHALEGPFRFGVMVAVLGITAKVVRRYTADAAHVYEGTLQFEEVPVSALCVLGLSGAALYNRRHGSTSST